MLSRPLAHLDPDNAFAIEHKLDFGPQYFLVEKHSHLDRAAFT